MDKDNDCKKLLLFPEIGKKLISSKPRRVIEASVNIRTEYCERLDFLHTVFCQVGMPKRHTEARIFERTNGSASLLLEAGRIWYRGKWYEQPLPYGTKPRLIMMHISGEAMRTQQRTVEIGDSMRAFLRRLGISTNGGARGGYTMFRKQMEALAACRMTIGLSLADKDITINTQPISRFEAWLRNESQYERSWPGILELSQDFFETLNDHAVPLDYRALGALKHSALALDIYTWLAHRLCRIKKSSGLFLSWLNLQQQFGSEYKDSRNFKKEFREALVQVCAVYPEAKVESTEGGFLFHQSRPPVYKKQFFLK